MLSAVLYVSAATTFALDVPPDAGLWEARLADAHVSETFSGETPPNAPAIRMSTVSVNYGPGRLELRGGTVVGTQQKVLQRVFRNDGSFYDREAGWFVYHPDHGHIHFEDWTVFRLRERTPEGGVGPVIRTGAKTSFCILELATWDSTLPGFDTAPSYSGCGQIQGLRPGRADIYSYSLSGQYIWIGAGPGNNPPAVPNGIYWLEGEIDPDNLVLEADETNNIARIPIAIGPPPATTPDLYEDNDTVAIVNSKPEGGTNSPNLGLTLKTRRIDGLSMDDTNDYYKVKLHAGGVADYIKIESPYLRSPGSSSGNITLRLLASNGTTIVRESAGSYNYEYIRLKDVPAGTYFIQVTRTNTTNNPNYSLEIEPGGNLPPNITVTEPTAPAVYVEKSIENVPVSWAGSDPDGDPKYASIFIDRNPVFGPTNIPVPGYQNLPGNSGNVAINSVGLDIGRWYVFVRATDGGAFTDVWAPGQAVVYKKGDLDLDGQVTARDISMLRPYYPNFTGMPAGFNPIADLNRNGVVDQLDYKNMITLSRR